MPAMIDSWFGMGFNKLHMWFISYFQDLILLHPVFILRLVVIFSSRFSRDNIFLFLPYMTPEQQSRLCDSLVLRRRTLRRHDIVIHNDNNPISYTLLLCV